MTTPLSRKNQSGGGDATTSISCKNLSVTTPVSCKYHSATTPRSHKNQSGDDADDNVTTSISCKNPSSAYNTNSSVPTPTSSSVHVNAGPAKADASVFRNPETTALPTLSSSNFYPQGTVLTTPLGVISGANLYIPGDTDVDMAPPLPECDLALFDGKFLFFYLIIYINIYVLPEPDLDIEIDPQGSSRSHGGYLCGNA